MIMPTVPYTKSEDGAAFVIYNPSGLPLRIGGVPFEQLQFVASADMLRKLREENPDVEFVEQPAGPVSG
jgi:hypothetical protein